MNRREIVILLIFFIICCIPPLLTFNRGINYFDEGYILEGARRILAGETPYRDFHFVYTPFLIYYLAVALRIFGPLVIVERIAAAFMSIIGIFFLGALTLKVTKNKTLTFLSMFIYAVWGPAHLNFLWPVMFILPLVFLFFLSLYESRFFLAGILMGIILLSKHNFGIALGVAFLCYLFCITHSRRQILLVLGGVVSIIALFTTYLFATQSFIPFLVDMNTYTIQEIVVRKSFSVPFPTQPVGKFILYLFPGIISLFVGIGLMKNKKQSFLMLIPLTVFFIYLFGIFPTPDWPHLIPLISMTGILFAVSSRIFGKRYRLIPHLFMILIIGAGLYSLVVRNYYRWEAPIIKHTHCFSSGRMRYMCVDEKNYTVLSQTVPLIEKEALHDAFIFAFYNNPLYYFLTNKDNPTRFIDFNVLIGKKEERIVVDELKRKKVRVIITRFNPHNNQSHVIINFLEKNYTPIKTVPDFVVWKLNLELGIGNDNR